MLLKLITTLKYSKMPLFGSNSRSHLFVGYDLTSFFHFGKVRGIQTDMIGGYDSNHT